MKVHKDGAAGRLCVTRAGQSRLPGGARGGPSIPPIAQSDMNVNQCDGERWKGRERQGSAWKEGEGRGQFGLLGFQRSDRESA